MSLLNLVSAFNSGAVSGKLKRLQFESAKLVNNNSLQQDTISFTDKVRSSYIPNIAVNRLEYPRPQMVRDRWQSLNGEWQFAFDDKDKGIKNEWHSPDRKLDKKINVPYPYQSELSGVEDEKHKAHKVVWYKKEFEVPKEWKLNEKKDDLMLHFQAVDYKTTVWVNGKELTPTNEVGHVPFSYNIAPYLKKDGKNVIAARVEDSQDPAQHRGKQDPAINADGTVKPSGIYYTDTTGIWQSVWLEPVPKTRIDNLKITPQIDPEDKNSATIEMQIPLHIPVKGAKVQAQIFDKDKLVSESEVVQKGTVPTLRMKVENPKLWSPEAPNLYDIRVCLKDKDGKMLDNISSYTGIRNVGSDDGLITLNDKPYFLKMILDQGHWDKSLIAAPNSETLKNDVDMIKKLGYNGVRIHQKVEDPRFLYWCDNKGLIVWGEMPNSCKWTKEGEANLVSEFEREIRRDYNHPSIMAWVPTNENMGVVPTDEENQKAWAKREIPIEIPNEQRALLERLVETAHREDPTRLVIDRDGWGQTDVTSVISQHNYGSPEELLNQFGHIKQGDILPENIPNCGVKPLLSGAEHHGQPVILSEMGGCLKEKVDGIGYNHYSDPKDLTEKYDHWMDSISKLPYLSGFCYTQYMNTEQEKNGLLDSEGKPIVNPDEIRAIHNKYFEDKNKP